MFISITVFFLHSVSLGRTRNFVGDEDNFHHQQRIGNKFGENQTGPSVL